MALASSEGSYKHPFMGWPPSCPTYHIEMNRHSRVRDGKSVQSFKKFIPLTFLKERKGPSNKNWTCSKVLVYRETGKRRWSQDRNRFDIQVELDKRHCLWLKCKSQTDPPTSSLAFSIQSDTYHDHLLWIIYHKLSANLSLQLHSNNF